MQLKVNNCGECPFLNYSHDMDYFTCWYKAQYPFLDTIWVENLNIIHPCCPEGGAFKIKTSPITIQIKEDESK